MNESRTTRFVMILLIGACALPGGCQQEMAKQPKYLPLEPSAFFGDGRASRPLVPGTVARGQLRTDRYLFDGKRGAEMDGAPAAAAIGAGAGSWFIALALLQAEAPYVDVFPFPVTRQVLERGRQRYTIFCAVCHGARGDADGIVVQRGFTAPPSYHSDRLRAVPVGYLFDVATR